MTVKISVKSQAIDYSRLIYTRSTVSSSIPANFFLVQRREIFIRILYNHYAHIQKCPKIFRKFTKKIRTFPKILQSYSELGPRISFAKHNLFSNCHLCALFNPLLLRVQITRLHIICLPGICQMAATTHTFQLGVRN